MIAIIARVELEPATVERFLEAAQPVIAASRHESGCNLYAIARDAAEGNLVWISEEWASEDDLTAHLLSPHIKAFLAQAPDLGVRSMDVKKYEVSSVGPLVMPDA